MPVFNIGFSEGSIDIPSCTFEAPTLEEALEKVWLSNAPTLDKATATVLGNGVAYRYLRRAGRWQQLASHPVPAVEEQEQAE